MKPLTIAALVGTLTLALLRPPTAGAQRAEPPRFPLPANGPAVVAPTPDHPGGIIPRPPGHPVPRPAFDPRPPIERNQRSVQEANRFAQFILAGMGIGMTAGIVWGARREATCGTCSMVPGGQLFAGFIGGMGAGVLAGTVAYVVTTPFRNDRR